MRKFIINVNGKSYEVEVEEVSGGGSQLSAGAVKTSQAVSAPKPAPAAETAAAPKPAEKPASGGATGSVKVNSPMPGSIWEVKVSPGDVVKKGQVVLILEAMKMENDILAPEDGTIVSIPVAKGSSVNAGDLLFSME